MNAAVKTVVENALIALLVAAVCLWMLVTAANLDEPPVARIVLLSLGLACALIFHLVLMVQVVKRSGRSLGGWIAALILLLPVASVALIALLYLEDKPGQTT
jgi:hypothetical protein